MRYIGLIQSIISSTDRSVYDLHTHDGSYPFPLNPTPYSTNNIVSRPSVQCHHRSITRLGLRRFRKSALVRHSSASRSAFDDLCSVQIADRLFSPTSRHVANFSKPRDRAHISDLDRQASPQVVRGRRLRRIRAVVAVGDKLQTPRFDRLPAEPSDGHSVVDRDAAARSTANRPFRHACMHGVTHGSERYSLSRCQRLAGVSTSLCQAIDDSQGYPVRC